MIKTCKVIWKNDAVAVVDYDGIQVQVPSDRLVGNEITLKKEGASFYICNGETGDETPEPETDEFIDEDEDEDAEENA